MIITWLIYLNDIPAHLEKGADADAAIRAVQRGHGYTTEKLRAVDARTAPFEDLTRLVSLVQYEFIIFQLTAIQQAGTPIIDPEKLRQRH